MLLVSSDVGLARTQHGEHKQRRIRENATSTNGRCGWRSRGADSCIARAGRRDVAGRQQPQPGRKYLFPAECHLRRLPYPGLGGGPDPGGGKRRRLRNVDRGVVRLDLERRSGGTARLSASSLNGVSGSGPSDIWAVGQNAGTSFIEHWNGQSWSHVASPASEPPDG